MHRVPVSVCVCHMPVNVYVICPCVSYAHVCVCVCHMPMCVVPRRIRAGTELTWDYNYEVGSVEGKELLCCCGSTECRGRLL